jgi:hypothetical protein
MQVRPAMFSIHVTVRPDAHAGATLQLRRELLDLTGSVFYEATAVDRPVAARPREAATVRWMAREAP